MKKKTEKFNSFIEELWQVWDDRNVTLEELEDLLKSVSKILVFTNSETSSAILSKLETIADYLPKDNLGEKEREHIQNSIFDIIDVLAQEMNLGGKISSEDRENFNKIARKVDEFKNKNT